MFSTPIIKHLRWGLPLVGLGLLAAAVIWVLPVHQTVRSDSETREVDCGTVAGYLFGTSNSSGSWFAAAAHRGQVFDEVDCPAVLRQRFYVSMTVLGAVAVLVAALAIIGCMRAAVVLTEIERRTRPQEEPVS